MATIVYLKNRTFCRSVNDIPFSLIKGHKPGLNHIRVFGCKAIYHLPKDERTKLEPKGKIAVFLGYCEDRRGYRLYDESKCKVVFSRDVVFLENKLGKLPENVKNLEMNFSPDDIVNVIDDFDANINCDMNMNSDVNVNSDVNSNANVSSDINLNVPDEPPAGGSGARRSSRTVRPPERFGEWTNMIRSPSEPTTYRDAIGSWDSHRWVEAMQTEMENMKVNSVFQLVDPPKNTNIIKSKWIFKVKPNDIYKARLVAQGYSQVHGIDYEETFLIC